MNVYEAVMFYACLILLVYVLVRIVELNKEYKKEQRNKFEKRDEKP